MRTILCTPTFDPIAARQLRNERGDHRELGPKPQRYGTHVHSTLNAGDRVGTYEVVALIGAGAMGQVYRARDTRLNRDVALKVLPEAFALDADRIARFKREAQMLAAVNHPN